MSQAKSLVLFASLVFFKAARVLRNSAPPVLLGSMPSIRDRARANRVWRASSLLASHPAAPAVLQDGTLEGAQRAAPAAQSGSMHRLARWFAQTVAVATTRTPRAAHSVPLAPLECTPPSFQVRRQASRHVQTALLDLSPGLLRLLAHCAPQD